MKQEIIFNEVIKPSQQTPTDCKNYKLSILDQLSPSIYVPLLLFYQAPHDSINVVSKRLKASLSETLTRYYVFAGRIKDDVYVECNDEGTLFLEAKIKSNLVDILAQPNLKSLNSLFPNNLAWKSSKGSSILAVQVSYFECKGLSIGICISHKVADACTMFNFLKDWASLTQQRVGVQLYFNVDPLKTNLFDTNTIFHPPCCQYVTPEVELEDQVKLNDNVVTTRYVFSPTKISELKSTVIMSSNNRNPSRVEIVASFLYKTILQAYDNNNNDDDNKKIQSMSYVLSHMVNLRTRFVPPLPSNLVGNLVWCSDVMINQTEDKQVINLASLVTQMREGLRKLCDFARNSEGKDWISMVMEGKNDNANIVASDNTNYMISSSWCKFGVYEIDFGWGKPFWVSNAENPPWKSFFLMDSQDGEGIEVWVTLDQDVMNVFQSDEQLLRFASCNPSIIGKKNI